MIRFIWILILGFSTIWAKDYALVIGVDGVNLIGAKRDANVIANILRRKGVRDITILRDKQATKNAILSKFMYIANIATSKDRVYLFFSGHGTSYYDPALQKYPKVKRKLKNTGALIPWGASANQYNKIIVASRDLKPIFMKLEREKVLTMVIFDACFSGEAYKRLPTQNNHSIFYPINTHKTNYPYRYIIYISGATRSDFTAESRSEKRGYFSMDIGNCLRKYSSLDGVRQCMLSSKFPSVVLPRKGDKVLFAKKDIILVPKKPKLLGDELFNLANQSDRFRIYSQKPNGKLSQNYTTTEKLFIFVENTSSGYLALFSRQNGKLKMIYPNQKTLARLNAHSNKRRFTITAHEPFGEEEFVGFLVDRDSALRLQKFDNVEKNIKKISEIIANGGFDGSRFSVIGHKN